MFSLPFTHTSLDIDNDKLLESIENYESKFTWPMTSKVKTSFGSEWTSQELLAAMQPHVTDYLKKYSRYVGPVKVQIWFNLYDFTFFQEEHTHSDFDVLLSGVYYAEMPENSRPTTFTSNYKDLLKFSGYKDELAEFTPEVKQGDLVIFPPFVKHYVPFHAIKERRITVAFNVSRGTT